VLTLRLPTDPPAEGFARMLDAEGNPSSWAVSNANPIGANPIDEAFDAAAWLSGVPEGCTRLLAWSGTLDDELFGSGNPMTWLGPGREALDGLLGSLAPALRDRGLRLLLRPHCRHVLGDATTARSFLETLDPGVPVGLALDIAAVFEPGMLRAAADHCRRTFEILGPVAEAIVLTGAEADGESVGQAPLDAGVLPAPLLLGLLGEHCRAGTPIALLDDRFEEQRRMLDQTPG